jgi:hypothetical protein
VDGADIAGSGSIDSLAIYNRNAGNNSDHDAFFNSLQILSPRLIPQLLRYHGQILSKRGIGVSPNDNEAV